MLLFVKAILPARRSMPPVLADITLVDVDGLFSETRHRTTESLDDVWFMISVGTTTSDARAEGVNVCRSTVESLTSICPLFLMTMLVLPTVAINAATLRDWSSTIRPVRT